MNIYIETLSKISRDEEKPKPNQSWIWQGVWRQRRASTDISTAKERPEVTWTCCCSEAAYVVTEDMENVGVLFALMFTGKICPQASQTHCIFWSEEVYLTFGGGESGKGTCKWTELEINKSLGPDGVSPWVLRELNDFTARALSIIPKKAVAIWGGF